MAGFAHFAGGQRGIARGEGIRRQDEGLRIGEVIIGRGLRVQGRRRDYHPKPTNHVPADARAPLPRIYLELLEHGRVHPRIRPDLADEDNFGDYRNFDNRSMIGP
jgi:hypothetical protein